MTTENDLGRRLTRRFRPLYLAQFFQGFVLWYAIEKVFMKSIGLTNGAIALETVLFTAVMLVANIPFGVLADRWSRKGVLAIAGVALAVSSAIGGISNSFWVYVASAACWGLFYAAANGTYDSIVYDTLLEEAGKAEQFEHYYGRLQLYDSVALVAGSLLSTAVTHFYGLRAAYFCTIPLAGCSIVAITLFHEPKLHRKEETALLIGAHLKATFKAIAQKGQVFWIVITMVLIGATMRVMFELDQLWLIAVALPLVLYGPVNALLLTGIGVSGPIARRAKNSRPAVMLVGVAVFVATCSLLTHVRPLIILAEFGLFAGLLALNIILGRFLHDSMPSNIRAGASSVVTTLGYLLFLPVGLLFGAISTHSSVFRAAWIVVAIVSVACATLFRAVAPVDTDHKS